MSFRPRFLKPKDWSQERNDPYETEQPIVYNPDSVLNFEQQRQRLPIFKYRNHILYLLENFQTVIVLGETGCGKSTQIPQYLSEAGWADQGIIGITQPRRVAATMLAARVAEEKGTLLGQLVGYSIRFEDCFSREITKIKFMTEGMLINEMMADPLLRSYSVLIIDEVHERSLNTDIILGLLRKVIKKRSDLKLIISSATFEAETIFKFFNKNETSDKSKDTSVIISVEGRNYPVDIHYSIEPIPDYIKGCVDTAIKIHVNEGPGDILIFLTGQEEVEMAASMLKDYARDLKNKNSNAMKLFVVSLYGAMPMSEQVNVFKRFSHNVRKIVVSTNIAEASVTIGGIAYIVDSCFVKLRCFNPHSCTDSLVIVPVSQASAEQRAGRAGRLRSGKAYRLCTEKDFLKLPKFTTPEMQRSNLAQVILQLKALGIENILRFPFPSAPPSKHVISALELLFALDAIDEEGNLTDPLGSQMAEFPLHPMFSKLLLISGQFGCTEEMLTIAAMLQVQNVFVVASGRRLEAKRAKWKFAVEEGDLITLLNVYNSFLKNKNKHWCDQNFLNYKGLLRAVEIRTQLSKLLQKFKAPGAVSKVDDPLRKCIVSAYFANAAFLHHSGVYKTIRGEHELHIHPESVVTLTKQPKWVVFNEVLHTTKEYMRDITVIEPSWLYELAPHYYQYGTDHEVARKKSCI